MLKRVWMVLVITAVTALNGAAVMALEEGGTVLVTGANRGIGLELASQLKAQGFNVIGTARKPDDAKELKALGVRVEQLDVSSTASAQALADRLDGVAIDLLINNAGVGGQQANSIRSIDWDNVAPTFDVNSIGPMRVTQALLDNLGAGDKQVVHISSILGSIAANPGGFYGYGASKAALNRLNKALALELANEGFICVVLHPGWVQTRMGGASAPVKPVDSVSGMLSVIRGLKPADNGRFFDYEGQPLPW